MHDLGSLLSLFGRRLVESLDVGEQNHELNANLVRYKHSKRVIIPEHLAALVLERSLTNANNVVFVKDGDDTKAEEDGNGGLEVLTALGGGKILVSDEHLTDRDVLLSEKHLIECHQATLTSSSGSTTVRSLVEGAASVNVVSEGGGHESLLMKLVLANA
jgi:hypothetical protein